MNWTLGEPFYKHWLGLQPLPRAFWTAEVNIQAGIDVQVGVLRHFCPLLPGQ